MLSLIHWVILSLGHMLKLLVHGIVYPPWSTWFHATSLEGTHYWMTQLVSTRV